VGILSHEKQQQQISYSIQSDSWQLIEYVKLQGLFICQILNRLPRKLTSHSWALFCQLLSAVIADLNTKKEILRKIVIKLR
jgi:hypothetical protein